MGDYIGVIVGLILILLIILFFFYYTIVRRRRKFKENQRQIKVGIKKQDVITIMGNPTSVKDLEGPFHKFIYEKSEFKGPFRGGTKVRMIEIHFDQDDIVTYIHRNHNIEMTAW